MLVIKYLGQDLIRIRAKIGRSATQDIGNLKFYWLLDNWIFFLQRTEGTNKLLEAKVLVPTRMLFM
jgi:hypothetical protein